MNHKKCRECENFFPATEDYWHKNKSYSDGFQSICKKCAVEKTREHEKNLSEEQRKLKNEKRGQTKAKQKFGEEASKMYPVEVFDMRDNSFKSIEYTKAYTSKKFYPGAVIKNSQGEKYTIHGKCTDKDGVCYVIKFTNSPYLLVLTKSKNIANRNATSVANLGYRGYGKYRQVDYPKEHQLWRKIVDMVSKREDVSIDDSWLDFQIFCKEVKYIKDYDKWLENNNTNTLSPSYNFHYSLEDSFFTNSYSTTLALGVIPTPKPFKDMGGEQECIGCENTFPFNSDYFTRAHRASCDADLQPICKDCSKKDIQLRYYEQKTLGRTLSWEERKQQKLDKGKESEERKIKKEQEQEEKRLEIERLKEIERNKPKPDFKVCPGCDTEKEFNEDNFQKDKYKKWGFNPICKKCVSERRKEKIESMVYETPDEKECTNCGNVFSCTEQYFIRDSSNKTGFENQCKDCAYEKKRLEPNRNKPKKRTTLGRVHETIAQGLRKHLKTIDGKKDGLKTNDIVGCDNETLLNHLNTGKHSYEEDYITNTRDIINFHIDHIIAKDLYKPFITFEEDGSLTEEGLYWLKKCWNYRNLRVWPAGPNSSKGNKLDMELVREHGIEDLLPPL